MQVKPGYKQTEVGVIPEDWECTPICEIATLESGHTPSRNISAYWNGDIPWVSLHDTDSLGQNFISVTALSVTRKGIDNSSARILPEGTVVFSRTATVGKVSILGKEMATSQDFANYICGPKLNNLFIVYLFRGMGRTWASLMAGSTHKTIYMPTFKKLEIPTPPIAEQRAIATALSDMDDLLSGLDRLIAKKRGLKQAAMQQLLNGKTRLPGFEGEWEESTLGAVGKCYRGVSYQPEDDLSVCDQEYTIRLYRSNNIQDSAITPVNIQYVHNRRVGLDQIMRTGDILLCMANGSRQLVGKVARFRGDDDYEYTFGAFMGCFRTHVDIADNRYVFNLMQSARFRNHIGVILAGSSINNLKPSDIEAATFDIPPLPEQTAIASILSDMDTEIDVLVARRAKTAGVKQAMMQELLTGRTRLVTAGGGEG